MLVITQTREYVYMKVPNYMLCLNIMRHLIIIETI